MSNLTIVEGLTRLYFLVAVPNLATRRLGDITMVRIAKFCPIIITPLFVLDRRNIFFGVQMRVTFSSPLTRPSVHKIV